MLDFTMFRDADGKITHIETAMTGYLLLTSAKLNKGSAFTQEERETFGLLGRLPHKIETLEQQLERRYKQYLELSTNFRKNIFLNQIHDTSETLFYALVSKHLKEMLPIIYTPTIGEAVEKFSLELRRPRGLFIGYEDRDRIETLLASRFNSEVDLILVTDGEGVLGIGDQGIGGMDIAIGKLMVYTLCAGLNPHRVLSIQLDVGTNNESLLNDPMYLGWRHSRIEGKAYDDFIGAFVSAVQKTMPGVFLHWEDFGRENARKNLNRYRNEMLTFNDDMQGTGATALSCVLSAVQAKGEDLTQQTIVFFGAGTAGVGIADQVRTAMVRQGLSQEEAEDRIWLIDRPGLLVDSMSDLPHFQMPYVKAQEKTQDWVLEEDGKIMLLDVVHNLKPTVLIGCSTMHGAFNEDVVTTMAAHVKYPIIFPLSNPTSKAEADPEDLLRWTKGKAIVATGSPYPDVELDGKHIRISQSNNAFVFPGLGVGAIAVKATRMTDNMLWAACQALMACSPAKQDKTAPILPDLKDIKTVTHRIAIAVATQAVEDGVAEATDIEKAINRIKWSPEYYPYVKS